MNILITSPDLNSVGGIPSVVNNILTLNKISIPPEKKRLNYFLLKVGRNSYNVNKLLWILNQFTLIYRFFYKVFKYKIHLIHINTAINTSAIIRDTLLCILSNILNKKSVLYIHGGKYFWDTNMNFILHLFVRIMLRLAGKVIVLSNKERTYLSAKYNPDLSRLASLDNIGIKVLPYCVLRHFAKININKNKEITEILFLGRIHPDKGIKEIIDSIRLLNSWTKNFRFILCGDGPKKQNIVKILSELLNDRFRYEGVVRSEKKYKILQSADILLLPSYYEAMPMSILEAMAYGCVPVVTDVGSVNTVIKHNNNGFFIKTRDYYDIADKLQYLIKNKAVLQQLSINAYQTIKKHYSCDNYIKNLKEIYEEIQ